MEEKKYYSIEEVSARLGVKPSTIRYWESVYSKFLHPSRTSGNQRRYTIGDIEMLETIKKYKELGYTSKGVINLLSKHKLATMPAEQEANNKNNNEKILLLKETKKCLEEILKIIKSI
jgi:DNA-binding transcriptional MerR regulator